MDPILILKCLDVAAATALEEHVVHTEFSRSERQAAVPLPCDQYTILHVNWQE
jgi:hypothetical protein